MIVAVRARSDSRRAATAAEQSAQAARDIASVEREPLDIELQPQFQIACRVSTIRVYNEGPVDYDNVTVRLLETEGGQAYLGIGADHTQQIDLGPCPVKEGYDVKVTRADSGQDRARVELVCRRGDVERTRVFECRAHRPPGARSRRPQGRLPGVGEQRPD